MTTFQHNSPKVAFAPAFEAGSLSQRVAAALIKQIQDDGLVVGTRLPAEQSMAKHFQVSRNVLREAIALLKKDGILDTRKGSGAFIVRLPAPEADAITTASIESLLNVNEVRQGLEGEIAALAALRRTPGQLLELERALQQIEVAAAKGQDGVEEDFNFHLLIAKATGNSTWIKLVEMFSKIIRSAMKVTRANEARQTQLVEQVIHEHRQVLAAIATGDSKKARAAAIEHLQQGAKRIRQADLEFWEGNGGELARKINHAQ